MIAALLLAAACHCGTERWAVKVGADSLAYLANCRCPDTETTIATLAAQSRPDDLSHRAGPEATKFHLTATLVKLRREADCDYHLVLADSEGRTMIAEIPSPACARGSVWLAQITEARAYLERNVRLKPSGWTNVGRTVTIIGPAFYDVLHGQAGAAPNGIEIHPVLSIRFAP